MRLLLLFGLLCAALLAAVGWHVASAILRDGGRPPPAAGPRVPAPAAAHAETPSPAAVAAPAADGPCATADIAGPDGQPALTGAQPVGTAATANAPAPAANAARSPGGATAAPATELRLPADPAVRAAQRRLEQARAALRAAPDSEAALRDIWAAAAELERWWEAAAALERLTELHPDDVALGFERGVVLLRLRRTVEAVPVLRAVVAARPDHARAWFNLAVAHQAAGHLGEARAAWDRALALAPSAEAHAQRGQVLLDLGEWAAAAADFEAVLAREPDAPDAVLNLALALARLGRADAARERLAAFVERHPRHVPALNRLAELAWAACEAAGTATGGCPEAAAWCRRSLAVAADQPEVAALLAQAEPGGGQ